MTDRERVYNLVNKVCDLSIKAIDKITELKQENSELRKQVAELKKPKKRHKFRLMTTDEHCNQTACRKCEYYDTTYGCYYGRFNHVNVTHSQPYKEKDGKYILIEVKE